MEREWMYSCTLSGMVERIQKSTKTLGRYRGHRNLQGKLNCWFGDSGAKRISVTEIERNWLLKTQLHKYMWPCHKLFKPSPSIFYDLYVLEFTLCVRWVFMLLPECFSIYISNIMISPGRKGKVKGQFIVRRYLLEELRIAKPNMNNSLVYVLLLTWSANIYSNV